MSEKSKFKRFGKFLILDHLVSGGMATICRARYLGEQIDKIVAIKMVKSKFSQNESFQNMFMDEVKVSFSLQHPNIVQTYDYGKYKNQFYVAMEYCDGDNLRGYLDAIRDKKRFVPVEIATHIASQICQGLFYAHTLKDKLTGNKLNIVHRDISPHNIMLTYDGAVKIIDFGIAKATSNSEVTQAGTIKGKLSYLAPEYLDGQILDGKYDQFALGITFWELLCTKKLFHAENDLAILKKIQKCEVPPPSTINPNVPKELDEIVLKSLSKDRNNRFENLSEMNKSLTKFLYQYKQDFNTADVASFAEKLFKDQIEKEREKFVAYGKIDITPYLKELEQDDHTNTLETASTKGKSNNQEQTLRLDSHEVMGEDGRVNKKQQTQSNLKITTQQSYSIGSRSGAQSRMAYRTRSIRLDDESLHKLNIRRKTPFIFKFTFVACLAFLFFFYKDKLPLTKEQSDKVQKVSGLILNKIQFLIPYKKNKHKRLLSSLGPTEPVKLLNIDKFKQKFFVEGIEVPIDVMNNIPVPLNRKSTIRIETPKRKHFIGTITLKPNKKNRYITYRDQGPASYGYLFSSLKCFSGYITFSLYGEERQESIPLERPIGFPLTSHKILLVKDNGKVEKKTFRPQKENNTTDICKL